ncbi:IS110 family transposase [Olsenella sp. DNF00959]|uniref:IS110 family transposase n=1 Tax=Olsenella sp. DNF00959 TaxID=1476999 RepID=UPI000780740A|nr:IS110 family transposase [Olsenella sp. DNF00959]KXB62971.1 transposase, IS116/IS110/IS902 family [Olsenella sp. DNF00959]
MARILIGGTARQTFLHHLTCVRCAGTDRRQLERRVKEGARKGRWAATVRALSCVRSIDEISAFCLAAEAGCLSGFPAAPEYASWCGLVPSEHSSGEREETGHIAKAGNSASRRTPVESAWHHASCSARPKRLPGEWGAPTAAIRPRGNACARELACWVWEIGRGAEGTYHR